MDGDLPHAAVVGRSHQRLNGTFASPSCEPLRRTRQAWEVRLARRVRASSLAHAHPTLRRADAHGPPPVSTGGVKRLVSLLEKSPCVRIDGRTCVLRVLGACWQRRGGGELTRARPWSAAARADGAARTAVAGHTSEDLPSHVFAYGQVLDLGDAENRLFAHLPPRCAQPWGVDSVTGRLPLVGQVLSITEVSLVTVNSVDRPTPDAPRTCQVVKLDSFTVMPGGSFAAFPKAGALPVLTVQGAAQSAAGLGAWCS